MLRRLACVDLPDLPLQLLVRAHPEWRDGPVALVAEERPEAPLLLLNRHARGCRLATGMRFGAAKSLVPELRAGAVSSTLVEEMSAQLVRDLQTFSPHVERDPVSAGVFYVDPCGLEHLYGGELSWARCVARYLHARSLYATVVVAFGRALSHAIVRGGRGVRVIDTLEEALALAREVPFERLPIQPKLRESLLRLGLSTLGDLALLGKDQLALRFGSEAARWCAVARGEEVLPLCAEPHVDTPRVELEIEPPDHDVARLCFVLKRALDPLLEDVRRRGASVRALWMRLQLERAEESAQRLEPSQATRDGALLLELLRLRLTAMTLRAPVERVVLEAELSDVAAGQLAMFGPRRDLGAGDRALARLKASYGADVVCRAVLEDAHLPEARYRWAELAHVALPERAREESDEPPVVSTPEELATPLVRRVLPKPEPLAGSYECDEGTGEASFVHAGERFRLTGPYRVSGGWWVREVERDYYFARSPADELLWVYFDRPRNGWFVQAYVD